MIKTEELAGRRALVPGSTSGIGLAVAQALVYLACAPKSNASYLAIDAALADVENGRTLPVPDHLKNAPHPGKGDRLRRVALDLHAEGVAKQTRSLRAGIGQEEG